MTLPTSGTISLNDVRIELEKPSAAISLNDTVVRTLAGKATGMISLADLYGKTATMTIELSHTIYNFNLVSVVDSIRSGYRGPVNLNVLGVVVRGTIGNVACNLYGQFGDIVFRNPHGFKEIGSNYIVGYGGSGGAGGTAGANNGLPGSGGGTALKVRHGSYVGVQGVGSLTYPARGFQDLGNWLSIYGGGGGGGGGGGASINQYVGGQYSGGGGTTVTIKAAGGGGGAGYGGQTGSGGGTMPEGGGAAGSGQTPSSSGSIKITSTAPTAGAGTVGYFVNKYYSPDVFTMNRSMDNAAGGTGGKVVAVSQGSTLTATGGNGGKGGVYAITDAMAGSAGNIGSFSGSVGAGGAPGIPGMSIFANP